MVNEDRLRKLSKRTQDIFFRLAEQKQMLISQIDTLFSGLDKKLRRSALNADLIGAVQKIQDIPLLDQKDTFGDNLVSFLKVPVHLRLPFVSYKLDEQEIETLWILRSKDASVFPNHPLSRLLKVLDEESQFVEKTATFLERRIALKSRYALLAREVAPLLRAMHLDVSSQMLALENGNRPSFSESLHRELKTEGDVTRLIEKHDAGLVASVSAKLSRKGFLTKIGKAMVGLYVLSMLGDTAQKTIEELGQHRIAMKGVCYDIGTQYTPSFISREQLSRFTIRRELKVIRQDLGCNAIRIYGGRVDLLFYAAEVAISLGMVPWVSPRFINRTFEETLPRLVRLSERLEKLRRRHDLVLVVGNEWTLDMKGILSGNTYQERGSILWQQSVLNMFSLATSTLSEYLHQTVMVLRKRFGGRITYACANWEDVDWNLFDIIGVNLYRDLSNGWHYESLVRNLARNKKPIAVLEFGCGTFKGAEDKGGASPQIVDWNTHTVPEEYVRSEETQAHYLGTLLKLFSAYKLYATFPFTFVEDHYPRDEHDPLQDLDKASFNLIAVYPSDSEKAYARGHIVPKRSFRTVADFYRKN
ncbi:MAG: hypothetical protein GXP63_02030 [DPANN group archaeon]|nr:hypothetical protein [DPANN group archaeon]